MTTETVMKKLENGRAEFAYTKALEGASLDPKDASKYKSYVKKIPVLIKTNGLGNTLAFIRSKNEVAYEKLYNQISEWIKNDNNCCKLLPADTDLLEFIVSQPSPIYRQITTETLAFLNWLRRLAEGMIEENEDE